jgi:membrane-associated phospholipid phosphatase
MVFSFAEGLFLSDWRGIALGTYVSLGIVVNYVSKFLSKMFFGQIGDRPPGAKDCGPFVSKNEPGMISQSYGMPSGHSQNFALVATLLGLGLYDQNKKSKTKDFYLPLKIGALFLLTVIAMYQRVIGGCHTGWQVIIGASIGVSLALLIAKHLPNPFSGRKYKGLRRSDAKSLHKRKKVKSK